LLVGVGFGGSGGLHLEEVAGAGGCFGEDSVVDGEEGEFEAVGDAGLVVDVAEVVLDDLLLGAELGGDVFVFTALDDEGDDLHLLGGEAVADAGSDAVDGLHGGYVGALEAALAAGDAADTVDKGSAFNVAADDAVNESGDFVGDMLRVFSDEDEFAVVGVGLKDEGGEVGAEAGGDEDDGGAGGFHGGGEAGQVFALGDDANVVLQGEDAGSSGTEDGLIIGENDSVHELYVSCRGQFCPCTVLIGDERPGGGRVSVIRTSWLNCSH
jgi:hypothetical protein